MPSRYSDLTDPLDRFSRTEDFLGTDGFAAFRRASVAVVGLGGVGSHAALALTRAGVGRLRLIDFDKVDPSNLNRHAVATPKDVGEPKPTVMKRHLLEVFPQAQLETFNTFFHLDTADELFEGSLDYVVDAIDGLNTKVALLRYLVEHNLPVVSSMGASLRSDPSLVRVDSIEKTRGCPLAKVLRKRLRRQGIHKGITAVYSTERVAHTSLSPNNEDVPFRGGRRRNKLPSLSTLPGIFGYAES